MQEHSDIVPMLEVLTNQLPAFSGDNFNYVQLYFERLLSLFTLNYDLWK